jgi:hypothetical protein
LRYLGFQCRLLFAVRFDKLLFQVVELTGLDCALLFCLCRLLFERLVFVRVNIFQRFQLFCFFQQCITVGF